MHDLPAVSIILPTHNRADLLPRAIDSVLRQTFGDFELIIVDDASRDETPGFLAALPDDRIRVITLTSNKGQAHARNIGIENARAPLIAFQDSDDVWRRHKLETQVDAIAALPHICVVHSDMRRVNADGTSFTIDAPRLADGDIFDDRITIYSPYGLGIQSCLARRSALLDVGGFDPRRRVWDDLELFLRLLDRGHRFHCLPEVLVDYHETVGVSHDRREKRRARLDLLKSYGLRLARRSPQRFVSALVQALRS